MTETKIPGIEKRTASFKVGKGFTWTGMKPDVESVDAEPNVSRQLINVRLRGGRIEGRGGQLLLASRGLPITGLADYFTEVIEMAEVAPMVVTGIPGNLFELQFFSFQLNTVGGVGPYSYVGNLESGNNADPFSVSSSGLVEGRCEESSNDSLVFTYTVTDSDGTEHTETVTISVLFDMTLAGIPSTLAGASSETTMTVTVDGDYVAPYTWSVTGYTGDGAVSCTSGGVLTLTRPVSDTDMAFRVNVTDSMGSIYYEDFSVSVI